jgi:hypothetical protein
MGDVRLYFTAMIQKAGKRVSMGSTISPSPSKARSKSAPSLEQELSRARKKVVTDGYEMSIGEIVGLYEKGELIINPAFQRYFRWDSSRKTKFIESLLLGIPIPPIFVFQAEDGVWELVDGLQRVSTLLEFMGVLRNESGTGPRPSLILDGTTLLPSLAGTTWTGTNGSKALSQAQKLDLRRARLRVEILKRESDRTAKFELFQRLNTGGAELSEQEVRNCTLVMMNPRLQDWIQELAHNKDFLDAIRLTEAAMEKQQHVELVLRFLAFRHTPYQKGRDVHDYLDHAAIQIAGDASFSPETEAAIFASVFGTIRAALGDGSFRRWDGQKFGGKFLMSVFEVLAYGLSVNLTAVEKLSPTRQQQFVQKKAKDLWADPVFQKYSGPGVRAVRVNDFETLLHGI